jgi:hypothetical protein
MRPITLPDMALDLRHLAETNSAIWPITSRWNWRTLPSSWQERLRRLLKPDFFP